jgi:AmmeMemoRadiSam system protein A
VHDLSALPAVAREAIRARLERRPPRPPPITTGRGPVFVTLRMDGELRGCMGTLEARCTDLVRETMERAVAAAFEDPRFPPLTAEELPRCTVEVTVIGPLGEGEPDPARYGIEVRAGDRRAVLLPGIKGIDTADQQVRAAVRKAGIDGPFAIRRFTAVKVEERGAGGPGEA